MTTTTVASRPPLALSRPGQWLAMVPGLLALFLIGYAGKIAEQSISAYGHAHHLTLPNIEYVLWAIAFGLIVSNTVGVPAIFEAGVNTYEFWLKTGIVLLGVRFLGYGSGSRWTTRPRRPPPARFTRTPPDGLPSWRKPLATPRLDSSYSVMPCIGRAREARRA